MGLRQKSIDIAEVCQTLLGKAGVPIYWLDKDARFIFVNGAVVEILGYSEDQLRTMTLADVDTNFTSDGFSLKWRALKESQAAQKDESVFRTGSGRLMPTEITAHYFIADDGEFLAVFIRDISVRKQAEEALRESEARLRLLLKELPCFVWTTDTESRYTYLAGSAAEALGSRVIDNLGRVSAVPDVITAHRKALAGTPSTFEHRASDKKTYLIRIEPFRDAEGQVIGALGLAVDVSESKEIEDQLRRSQKKLTETASAYVNAQEEEREWTAMEIHDRIVQNLTAVSHMAQRLKPNVSTANAPLLDEMLVALKGVLQETRTIMAELYPANIERYGLLKLIDWDLNSLETAIDGDVSFAADLKTPLHGTVETTLYRISHEALLNIRKHAKSACHVNITLKERAGWVKMEICDDGPGFGVREKKSWLHGGLDSMRRRAEIIGGTFSIVSSVGTGTRVTVRLPMVPGKIHGGHRSANEHPDSQ